MAKTGGAKARRIPKKIAGVKIPKEARRAGERLLDRASSPEGQRMIAQGLAMAATVAATAAARKASAATPAPPVPPTPPVPPVPPTPPVPPVPPPPPVPPVPPTPPAPPRPGEGGTTTIDPHQVANAIGQAADAFLSKLFGGRRPG